MWAFGLGTDAWALWVDAGSREVRVRRYDTRMVIPSTRDEEGVAGCAFATRTFWRGRAVDQLQLHLRGAGGVFFSPGENAARGSLAAGSSRPDSSPLENSGAEGTYQIVTVRFDRDGNQVEPEGVRPAYDTESVWPTFSVAGPAIDNTRVDMSPYGQSVFADAVDAIQAVDLCYDAMMSEVDNWKARAFRMALQTLGDLCGFGINYFNLENVGHVKTATEVSADNSALMRNIRRHEHAPEGAVAGICRAPLAVEWYLGEDLPEESSVQAMFDDSIISDTAAEKKQDMDEVAAGLQTALDGQRVVVGCGPLGPRVIRRSIADLRFLQHGDKI